jgi:hypothetical protein
VSETKDPPRYRLAGSGASDAARALLDASRNEAPDAAQIARLAGRLKLGAPSNGGGHGPSGAAPQPPSIHAPSPLTAQPAPVSLLPSMLIGASLALAVVFGMSVRDGSFGLTRTPQSASPALGAPVASTLPSTMLPAAPSSEPRSAAAESTSPLPASSPTAPGRRPEAAGSGATASTGSSVDGANLAADPAATEAEAETEAQLLQRAQQALPGDPAKALALAEAHLTRFRGGNLAQEREVIAVSALVALGKTSEARSRAARFVQSYPRSAHRPGIEALLPEARPGD